MPPDEKHAAIRKKGKCKHAKEKDWSSRSGLPPEVLTFVDKLWNAMVSAQQNMSTFVRLVQEEFRLEPYMQDETCRSIVTRRIQHRVKHMSQLSNKSRIHENKSNMPKRIKKTAHLCDLSRELMLQIPEDHEPRLITTEQEMKKFAFKKQC